MVALFIELSLWWHNKTTHPWIILTHRVQGSEKWTVTLGYAQDNRPVFSKGDRQFFETAESDACYSRDQALFML